MELDQDFPLNHLWLELTAACNLNCSHCYADSGPHRNLRSKVSRNLWVSILNDARDYGCSSVQFIGGEPTISPDFQHLLEAAHQSGFSQIEVFTNATRLSDDLLNSISRNAASVACSFYSADPQVHDQITRRTGSFLRTVKGIQNTIALGLKLRIDIVETSENVGHASDAASFLHDLGLDESLIHIDSIRPVGRAAAGLQDETAGLCGQCWKGRLCITPDGTAFPCVMSRSFPVGNVLNGGLKPILNAKALLDARKTISSSKSNSVSCIPTDCVPNKYCGPDDLCGPGKIRPDEVSNAFFDLMVTKG